MTGISPKTLAELRQTEPKLAEYIEGAVLDLRVKHWSLLHRWREELYPRVAATVRFYLEQGQPYFWK